MRIFLAIASAYRRFKDRRRIRVIERKATRAWELCVKTALEDPNLESVDIAEFLKAYSDLSKF